MDKKGGIKMRKVQNKDIKGAVFGLKLFLEN